MQNRTLILKVTGHEQSARVRTTDPRTAPPMRLNTNRVDIRPTRSRFDGPNDRNPVQSAMTRSPPTDSAIRRIPTIHTQAAMRNFIDKRKENRDAHS